MRFVSDTFSNPYHYIGVDTYQHLQLYSLFGSSPFPFRIGDRAAWAVALAGTADRVDVDAILPGVMCEPKTYGSERSANVAAPT